MPRETMRWDAHPVTSSPSACTRPDIGLRRPMIALRRVDFPEPLGPTIATIEPASAFSPMPSMTGSWVYPAVSDSTLSKPTHLAAQVRVHDTAVLPQLGHGAASQYFPLDHNGHPATDALDDAEVVLNHQQRDARLLNVLKVLAHALDQSRVDPSHRLVEEHQFRLGHHGSSQLEKSLLPSADVARVLVT